jgi:hypothetical protein
MSIAHTLTATTATVVVNFTPKVIGHTHPNFKRVVELLKNPKTTEEQIAPLLDIPASISVFTGGQVSVINGKLYFNGYEVKTSLAKKIMAFINAGDDTLAQPLMRFLENVQQNPDPRAGSDLYDWVEASGLPLTGDGMVLAWKAVGNDYLSIHSGKRGRLSHKIGEFVSEPREETDSNPDQTCSRGLHFCSAPYLSNYAGGGSRIVVVKIHPKDVVAFPRDYGLQKGRACAYQVVGEVPLDKVGTFYPQGKPVYRGFDTVVAQPVAAPAPVQSVGFPFTGTLEVGATYRLRDGREGKVLSLQNSYRSDPYTTARLDIGIVVFAKDGRGNKTRETENDVVALVKAAPEVLSSITVKTGNRYRRRDGKEVTVKEASPHSSVVFDENGEAYFRSTGRKTNHTNSPGDLVTDLGVARSPRNGQFAVGQTWRARNGQTVKITSINAPSRPTFPIAGDNGGTFTVTGRYYESQTSPMDLVSLVIDVA